MKIAAARPLATLNVSRAYARRDMDLMIEQAFHPPAEGKTP